MLLYMITSFSCVFGTGMTLELQLLQFRKPVFEESTHTECRAKLAGGRWCLSVQLVTPHLHDVLHVCHPILVQIQLILQIQDIFLIQDLNLSTFNHYCASYRLIVICSLICAIPSLSLSLPLYLCSKYSTCPSPHIFSPEMSTFSPSFVSNCHIYQTRDFIIIISSVFNKQEK